MKAESFCYWLQGFFELEEPQELKGWQVKAIRNHLNLVFLHDIDPKLNLTDESIYDKIHNAGKVLPGSPGDGDKLFRC